MTLRDATEVQECAAFHKWRCLVLPKEPRLEWLHHIPNGEARPSSWVPAPTTSGLRRVSRVGQRLSTMGTLRGIVDYCLPEPVAGQHGLYLEMKRAGLTPGQAWAACTPEQQAFLTAMQAKGYATVVAAGWIVATRAVCDYLGREELAYDL